MSTPSESHASPPTRTGSPVWLVGGVALVMLLVGLGGGYVLFKGSSTSAASSGGGTVSGLPVASTIGTVQGWYRNTTFTYINFGPNTNVTAPILVLTENGVAVAGQHNIINVLPGQPGYSAFWRVYTVAVPSGYVANTVRSYAAVVDLGYTITETATVVNCPVINPNTTIQGPNTGVTQGWYQNETVNYWSGETNSLSFGDVVAAAPLYAFSYANGTSVANQMHVVNVIPGQVGYSDLWQIFSVIVPANYVANTYQSTYAIYAAEMAGTVTVQATSTMVNCPVVS